MNRFLRRTVSAAAVAIAVVLASATAVAFPGAWTASAPRLSVASSQLERDSAALAPPAGHADGVVERVVWRYRQAPGAGLLARLCHGHRCVRLNAARGSTEAFAGLAAAGPFVFRFRLAEGAPPQTVEGMTVIVNHR
ncbi:MULTISPECIES: flagellar protein FlhE [Halomonas]|uniref:flagellar protein FlhE n=1 Tax=Halomonas TaxID=2745 RepID=UPI001A8FD666|nr:MULTISPECIES: flagellar protein FlhE [Halomonas]MBN8412643.1 flagellar protein FlhE [Halomonas litopenaei]MED5296130.1 flagellar protein FlhE [Pseudomonadota bacterium]MBY5924955.1 flagellar protein FlhE [Halomonas sp. DP4Y7-2]MBY5967906.1 flagellar protein FlhE [Halomonas denitrificans]MBY5983407.1 flagellar protein FlhE [Halomonas sp. DP5Y7-2]